MVYENKEKEAIKILTQKFARDIAELEKNKDIVISYVRYDIRESRMVEVCGEIGPFIPLNPGPLRFHVRWHIPEL